MSLAVMLAAAHTQVGTIDDSTASTDEPPDERREDVTGLPLPSKFTKHAPNRNIFDRRESLLTRQLHASEGESHDEESVHSGARAMSHSSAADLTSDNDLTSPGTRCTTPSPPLPPTTIALPVSPFHKHTVQEPVIVGQDSAELETRKSEQHVESGLGRKRCITFACGGKAKEEKPKDKGVEKAPAVDQPPKRKCALTFICPTRAKAAAQRLSPIAVRHMSPAPANLPKSPRSPRVTKSHRNSDATITNPSPVALLRKTPSTLLKRRKAKYADAIDEESRDAKRFHEFDVSNKADDDWTELSTVYQNRMTIDDTLKKENVIRRLGQEVEDEENDEDDDEAILDELDAEEKVDEDEDDDDERSEDEVSEEDDVEEDASEDELLDEEGMEIAVSDGGFSTDDEEGFANSSESDGEGSDYEWWAPGRSTAATSTEQLDLSRPAYHRKMSDSSLESAREANGIVLQRHKRAHRKIKSGAVRIEHAPAPELPDSTDFVCGTLDEDRPLEQAYLTSKKEREAAKRIAVPQDIDPTFPTSDFENDDDEEDEVSDKASEADTDQNHFMPGKLDLHGDHRRGRDTSTNKKRSPLPSPRRLHSPPSKARIAHRSPAPKGRRASLKSPPPPLNRGRCRSPPPKKLFNRSPVRHFSPPPVSRPTSPPNSCVSSADGTPKAKHKRRPSGGLASRPVLDYAASLPRVPTMNSIHRLTSASMEEDDDTNDNTRRHRGAIDIVKGLEKKRARRREKLYQKQCQKARKDVEKRCKPGKGAERMRELGLELAAYRGKKAEHILSI